MTRLPHPFDVELEAEAIEAFGQGERAERRRIVSIIEHAEAVGREGTAAHLALHTDLPVRAAIQVLALTPRCAEPAHRVRPLRWPAITFEIEGVIHVGFEQLTPSSAG